ncbi:MAG: zinc ribbon domain-containing protein [Thermoproteus sp.]
MNPKTVYRTFEITRPFSSFPEEDMIALATVAKKVKALAQMMDYREIALAIAEGEGLRHFYDALLKTGRIRFTDFQIRVNGEEKDEGKAVLVDLANGMVELRKFVPNRTIMVKLKKSEVKYIKQRLEEGAALVRIETWFESNTLRLAFVFKREVAPIQPKRLVAVSASPNGVVVALIDGKIAGVRKFGIPSKVYRLLKLAAKETKKKRDMRMRRVVNIVTDFVNRTTHDVIETARRHEAEIWIDAMVKDRGIPIGDVPLMWGKLLVRKIARQARWYGIPMREMVLSDSKCPKCGAELRESEGKAVCDVCGFTAPRNHVPLHWALKMWTERRA